MTSTTITDRAGLYSTLAIKSPVRAITTANRTLSGLTATSITFARGVSSLSENDRVLVLSQTDTTDNGIYTASTGTWVRAQDFDGARDAVPGTIVPFPVAAGFTALYSANSADDPITIDTSGITFDLFDDPTVTYSITAAEIAASVTPTSTSYEPGDLYRYGAAGDASTDDSTALLNALKQSAQSGGRPAFTKHGTHRIATTVAWPANAVLNVYAPAGFNIATAVTAASGMKAVGFGRPVIKAISAAVTTITSETMFYNASAVTGVYFSGFKFTSSGVCSQVLNLNHTDNDGITLEDFEIDMTGATTGQTTALGVVQCKGHNLVFRNGVCKNTWRDHAFNEGTAIGSSNNTQRFFNCVGAGGSAVPGHLGFTLEGIDFQNVWNSIYVDNYSRLRIDRVNITDDASTAIFERCTLNNSYGKEISNVQIFRCGKSGIKTLDSNNLLANGFFSNVHDVYIEDWGMFADGEAILSANNFDGAAYAEDTSTPSKGLKLHNVTCRMTQAPVAGTGIFVINNNTELSISDVSVFETSAFLTSAYSIFSWCPDARVENLDLRISGTLKVTKSARVQMNGGTVQTKGPFAIDNQQTLFTSKGVHWINTKTAAAIAGAADTAFGITYTNNNVFGLYDIEGYFQTELDPEDSTGGGAVNVLREPSTSSIGRIRGLIYFTDGDNAGASAGYRTVEEMVGTLQNPVHGHRHAGSAIYNSTKVDLAIDTTTVKSFTAD